MTVLTGIVSDGGQLSTPITAGTTGDTTVLAKAGRLCKILVTTLGTNAMIFFDNASGHTGTIIAVIPASSAAGTIINCQAPALLGITAQGNAANPAITVFYSDQ